MPDEQYSPMIRFPGKSMILAAILSCIGVAVVCGAPVPTFPSNETSSTAHGNLNKRFFSHSDERQERARPRDFMNEVIGSHGHQPDRWMDFYNNGASWDHYMSPQLHHHSQMNVHDPHYDVHLSYHDSEDLHRASLQQAHHIESYPGEVVSGENSLSKFVAPPVFDGLSDSTHNSNRDRINEETRRIVNSPEGAETEQQNTQELVDSLKSLMTPLKMPAEDNNKEEENPQSRDFQQQFSNRRESNNWPGDRETSMEDERRNAQSEARQTHDEFNNFDDGAQNEMGKSRQNLGRTERNNDGYNGGSRDTPRDYEENRSFEHEDDRPNDFEDSHDRHDDHMDDFTDHGDFHDKEYRSPDSYISNNDNVEKFHDDRKDDDHFGETFHRHRYEGDENDNFTPGASDSDNRDNIDSFYGHDNFDNHGKFKENFDNYGNNRDKDEFDDMGHQDSLENFDSSSKEHLNNFESENHHAIDDQPGAIGSPFGKPHPIEMVQDDRGKLKPLETKTDLQAKHVFSNIKKEDDLYGKATRKSVHPETNAQPKVEKIEKLLNTTLPKL